MFEIKKALRVFREVHPSAPTYDASQGDGGASLRGVPSDLLETAHSLLVEHGTAYDDPAGTADFRRCVIEDYWQLGADSGWGPENVVACQGGRDALLKAYDSAQFLGLGRRGDFVVTSRVPWISYNWGPYGVGANVMLAPGDPDRGWALSGEGIEACVEYASGLGGRRIAMLILTSPDNPTGRTTTVAQQAELARCAFRAGVPFVLFDWIYHRVTDETPHDVNDLLIRFGPEDRARCIVLDGITKSLGASNVRNAHLLASEPVAKFIRARASHGVIPSFHSQAVAMAAYRKGFGDSAAVITKPTGESRRVLAKAVADLGIRHVLGQGYYAFLDVGPWLDRAGFADSAALGRHLAETFGLAVVPGVYFSPEGARWIRFSYALAPEVTQAAVDRLWEGLEAMGRP
jgi:aspartate/methionine/tyrosine aminotransferase